MIAPPRPNPTEEPNEKKASLPGPPRFLSAATWAIALPVAVCLLGGRVWLAVSLGAGMTLSLVVCGLLYVFVEFGMKLLTITDRTQKPNLLPLLVLLPGKFLILGLAGWAIFSVRAISLPAVLVGFVLAQAAIVVTASRKPRTGK